jgi:hypothetical protein
MAFLPLGFMARTATPSIHQLQRAIAITEQIQNLEAELASILGGALSPGTVPSGPKSRKKRRKMSAEAREKIAAAQRARWAKTKSEQPSTPTEKPGEKKKRGKMSAEGRAAIVAAQKKRWAKVRRETK